MTDGTIERRQLLRGAGAVAGGAAAATGIGAMVAPAAAHDGDHHRKRRLTGSWLVDVQNAGGTTSVSVGSFAEGGVAIVHDINPAGPPFTGSWAMGRGDRFRATVWSGFPGEEGPGSAGGTLRLRIWGTVGRHRIQGSFQVTVFDPTGTEVARESGTFSGHRIEA